MKFIANAAFTVIFNLSLGVGYVGSEVGTQLSNFMGDNAGNPSVVLLDEFDHCDPETWEAFYHIFDEGTILFMWRDMCCAVV